MGRELASPFCDLKRTSSFVAEDCQEAKDQKTNTQASLATALRRSKSAKNLKRRDPGKRNKNKTSMRLIVDTYLVLSCLIF